MDDVLPPDISQSADLRGNEYGWRVSSFPEALARAETHGYAAMPRRGKPRLYGKLFSNTVPRREGM